MNNYFYENDKWNLKYHPNFHLLTKQQLKKMSDAVICVDFSLLTNKILKNEVKKCCENLIESNELSLPTFSHYIRGIKVFVKYAELKKVEINTIDCADFKAYLVENGYTISVMSGSSINAQMERKKYSFSNIYERFLKKLITHLKLDENQKDDDIWDVRELPFKCDWEKPSRPRYTISFKGIVHEELKIYAKKYTCERLKTKKYSTCVDDIKGIALFSYFLTKMHPEIDKIKDVNRIITQEFLSFITTKVMLAPRTKVSRVGSIRNFFELCSLLGYKGIPGATLFYTDDYSSPAKVLPHFYDEQFMKDVNKHLDKIPVQIARMFYVLQNIGMRISELCELEPDCLSIDKDGDYILEYYQPKTRVYNRVPIKTDVSEAIIEAIKYSQKNFGYDNLYVFAKSKKTPISMDSFTYHMNRLIFCENITGTDGKLVRICPHTFRGTVATAYANAGLSMNLIRMLLGQKSLGAIKYYVEIHDKTVSDAMEPIIDVQNDMIGNMGVETFKFKNFITYALPNGTCVKPVQLGVCKSATACYECSCFKSDINHLDLYKEQLVEVVKVITFAKKAGYTRLLEINQQMQQSLLKVIVGLEGE